MFALAQPSLQFSIRIGCNVAVYLWMSLEWKYFLVWTLYARIHIVLSFLLSCKKLTKGAKWQSATGEEKNETGFWMAWPIFEIIFLFCDFSWHSFLFFFENGTLISECSRCVVACSPKAMRRRMELKWRVIYEEEKNLARQQAFNVRTRWLLSSKHFNGVPCRRRAQQKQRSILCAVRIRTSYSSTPKYHSPTKRNINEKRAELLCFGLVFMLFFTRWGRYAYTQGNEPHANSKTEKFSIFRCCFSSSSFALAAECGPHNFVVLSMRSSFA